MLKSINIGTSYNYITYRLVLVVSFIKLLKVLYSTLNSISYIFNNILYVDCSGLYIIPKI
jgi:hypothetical protein